MKPPLKSGSQIMDVAEGIGEFIEYWGFKKIHGRIWTLIFLAEKPVDAKYLIDNLNVSKSLVSMSLKDLISFSVILESTDKKSTVHYISNPNMSEVILNVLMARESKIILKIKSSCELLNRSGFSKNSPLATESRAKKLTKMVNMADKTLKTFISLKQLNFRELSTSLNLKIS